MSLRVIYQRGATDHGVVMLLLPKPKPKPKPKPRVWCC